MTLLSRTSPTSGTDPTHAAYGWLAAEERDHVRSLLDDLARIHHGHAIALESDAEVVG
jgi:hypothetical protein